LSRRRESGSGRASQSTQPRRRTELTASEHDQRALNPGRTYLVRTGWFLLGTVVFTLAYCQAPLYFSNQNQYFLHGLAQAGERTLDEDWLANTKDPTPVFSFLVASTVRYLDASAFYLFYGLLLGVYFASMLGIFGVLAGPEDRVGTRFAFATLFLLTHAALPRLISAHWLGVDYPWYLQAGLAGQYVLGAMFQPSTFGVLLIVSLLAFAHDRPLLAGGCIGLGCIFHSTYLLSGACLTLAYLVVLLRERRVRMALATGGVALLLVLPVVVYSAITFRPTSPGVFAEAQNILVHFRIPHHTIPRLWFDEVAGLQLVWIVLGIALAWGSRLFPVLVISSGLAFLLTVIQVLTDNNTLALLFPWRLSAILLPVSTAIIVTRLVTWGARVFPDRGWLNKLAWGLGGVVCMALVVGGLIITVYNLGFRTNDEELPLMAHVREHHSPGAVYLLPIRVPELEKVVRGSRSSSFKPFVERRSDKGFLPVDLQRFRLHARTPIYVDFKSIPYLDREVIDWRQRLRINERLYDLLHKGASAEAAEEMEERGITHVVTQADQVLDSRWFVLEYKDEQYRVYRVGGG
jgi:hypothetical protein